MRMLARLMRRSAGGRSADANDRLIEGMGGSLGADVTQSTLVFQGAVIARSLDRFVEALIDTIARPTLPDDELERLRRETEAELKESLDDDRGLANRWFRRRIFPGHPYSRSSGGTLGGVRSVTGELLKALRPFGKRDRLQEHFLELLLAFQAGLGRVDNLLEVDVERLEFRRTFAGFLIRNVTLGTSLFLPSTMPASNQPPDVGDLQRLLEINRLAARRGASQRERQKACDEEAALDPHAPDCRSEHAGFHFHALANLVALGGVGVINRQVAALDAEHDGDELRQAG